MKAIKILAISAAVVAFLCVWGWLISAIESPTLAMAMFFTPLVLVVAAGSARS